MTKTYLITLTPTGKFFFGGDMTFTVNGKESEFTSYIIRSNKFPQQTSLLGMLRFLILRNDENVFDASTQSIKDRKAAANLIGPKSFENSNKEGDFGKIKKLHHCFLQVCKDSQWVDMHVVNPKADLQVTFDNPCLAIINEKLVEVPKISFEAKELYETEYICSSCGKATKESEIFKEDICNGINRDIKTGKTDDNALFKQVFYRFNNKGTQYRFAFYAEMDLTEDEVKKYNGQLVSIGGDNSQFVVGIEQKNIPQTEGGKGTKVVLESPAYLTKEDLEKVRFAITDTIPFKCMKTKTESVESYNKRNQKYDYSESISLYDKGSVFYFKDSDDATDFIEKLKQHADFYQIGYNHYQVK